MPIKRPRRAQLLLLLLLVSLGACGDDSPDPEAGAVEAPTVEGAYRFSRLNDQLPPVEFPAASGSMIETGTLEIDPSGRFAMSFIVGGPLGSEPSGQQGQYRVSADTIYFTPEGAAGEPVTFQFEVGQTDLRLRDAQQNLWLYTRTQRPG
jgi:hypothetical protein